MAIGQLWAGRAYGTNTGNLFIKLEGADAALTGVLHFNDEVAGVAIYSIHGKFEGSKLRVAGEQVNQALVALGAITLTARLDAKGELAGQWNTVLGLAGTLRLFPHDQMQASSPSAHSVTGQLYTARHEFGAIEIDREQLTALAEEIQQEFDNAQLVVSALAGSEQARLLSDFKIAKITAERTTIVRIYVQQSESDGFNRVVQVEFGPFVNFAMTQYSDEAWVLGMLERLKRAIGPHERKYATGFKKYGVGINQILLAGMIIYMPSFDRLWNRIVFSLGIFLIIGGIDWFHRKYIPFAAIYLGEKRRGAVSTVGPVIASWVVAATAGVAATLLASYLQGYLGPLFKAP